MKAVTTMIASALLCFAGSLPVLAGEKPASRGQLPTIAIIIDDMGHDRIQGERLIALDQPLTLAFLPFRLTPACWLKWHTAGRKKSCCTHPWRTPGFWSWAPAGWTRI